MKTLLLILFVVSASIASGQDINPPIDGQTKKISFTEVVKVDSVSQGELYKRAKTWFVTTYKSSKDVIQMDDKESGEIIGKAVSRVRIKMVIEKPAGTVSYTITVQVKEGRYKYTITDFVHSGAGSEVATGGALENEKPACGFMQLPKAQWNQIKQEAYADAQLLIISLKAAMEKPGSSKDDW